MRCRPALFAGHARRYGRGSSPNRKHLLSASHLPTAPSPWRLGDVDPEDWEENQSALEHRNRLLSVYHVTPELTLWIITEWDRSATTMLLPNEY